MRGFFSWCPSCGYNHVSEAPIDAEPAPDTQRSVSLLEKTPFLFETLLRDLTVDLLLWKPVPDRWSISEVLAHLVEIEDLYSNRVRRMLAEDAPRFLRYAQPAADRPNAGSRGSTAEILARFTTLRRDSLTVLKSMPAGAGARTGHHCELGPITLAQMLNEWASHDLGHLRQMAELYRARAFYPYAGPFQKYSNPKP